MWPEDYIQGVKKGPVMINQTDKSDMKLSYIEGTKGSFI